MEGDLSVGCGSSVGRCCCKLCWLLHVSCASTVGTADLWSDLFFCFSVPVVSRGVMGLEMVVGRSDKRLALAFQ